MNSPSTIAQRQDIGPESALEIGPAGVAHPRQLDQLMRITEAIADAVNSEQVYAAVVQQVGDTLGASSAGLWILREGSATADLVGAKGYSDTTRRQLASLSVAGGGPSMPILDSLRKGEPVWIASKEDLVRAYPHLAGMVTPDRGYRVACLPIVARHRTIGALGLTFDDPGDPDQGERTFLRIVARYTGQALERLSLLETEQASRARTETAAQRISLLYGLARAVIGADSVDQVFEAALDAIKRALGTDRASILAFDADGVMRFKAWRGLSERYRRAVEGHSPWSRDTPHPEPIVVSDAVSDPSLAGYRQLFRTENIAALGFIPVVADGRLLGKFMMYYATPRTLAAHELELARAIADHVAAAISRFSAVARLEQTVRFNEIFTGILGHDLRNPLAAIITAAQLAMTRDESQRLVKPLSRILSSGARMTRMIDQLLDFTRVRMGSGIPLDRKALDLMPVVRQVMDELDDANPAWTLRLDQQGDTNGVWDADRLSQVFSNLVANAVQHGLPHGGVSVVVDGTARDSVKVQVHNAGTIPAPLLGKVFEPLSGGRRLERSGGLGLGLYISHQIVKSHGGEIDVRCDDVGTTFVVRLPRAPQPDGAP